METEFGRNSAIPYQPTGIDRTGSNLALHIPNTGFVKRNGTVEGTSNEIIRSPFFPEHLEFITEASRPPPSCPTALNQVGVQPMTEQRPASVPLSASTIQDLYMPPRRKLPFTISSVSEKTIGQSSISAQDHDSVLPKPTPVTVTDQTINPPKIPLAKPSVVTRQPAKRGKTTKKSPVKSKDEQALASKQNENSLNVPTSQESPLAAKSRKATRPASAMSGLQTKANPPRKRPASAQPLTSNKKVKMVDCATQTEPVSIPRECNETANTKNHRNHEEEVPFAPAEEYLKAIDSFVTKNKHRPAPRHLLTTPEYQSASQQERDALLNDFICRNLQDAKFLQLCKDMENAWRRIGLGR
jgi:hypothetical protein